MNVEMALRKFVLRNTETLGLAAAGGLLGVVLASIF